MPCNTGLAANTTGRSVFLGGYWVGLDIAQPLVIKGHALSESSVERLLVEWLLVEGECLI